MTAATAFDLYRAGRLTWAAYQAIARAEQQRTAWCKRHDRAGGFGRAGRVVCVDCLREQR